MQCMLLSFFWKLHLKCSSFVEKLGDRGDRQLCLQWQHWCLHPTSMKMSGVTVSCYTHSCSPSLSQSQGNSGHLSEIGLGFSSFCWARRSSITVVSGHCCVFGRQVTFSATPDSSEPSLVSQFQPDGQTCRIGSFKWQVKLQCVSDSVSIEGMSVYSVVLFPSFCQHVICLSCDLVLFS